MADLVSCITRALAQKRISQTLADQIINSPDPEYTFKLAQMNMTIQRRETILSAVRMNDVLLDMKSHPKGMAHGLMAAMVKDKFGLARYDNVDYQAKVIEARYHARVADMLSRFRTRLLGFSQDEKGVEGLVRALYGRPSGDAQINEFADALKILFDDMRKDFNKSGGSIPKNQNWNMPSPSHNRKAVERVPVSEWKSFFVDDLDRQLMVDDLGNPLSDAELDKALDYVYETIVTDGLHKLKELSPVPHLGKKLSRRHSEKRFLYFKDGDAWLKYNKRFGSGDPLSAITNNINAMSHEIALMQKFGPNPPLAFQALFNEIKKAKQSTSVFGSLEWTFKTINGDVDQVNHVTLADFAQHTRNVISASTLHSAFLSALSDPLFGAITANYRKVPFLKTMLRTISLLNPANEADRIFATKLNLGADAWIETAMGANRFADVYGTGVTRKMNEVVMRGSFLKPWTDASRKAFGMEYTSVLADNFHKSFDELDWEFRRAFEEYTITPEDWNIFRQQTPLEHKGAKFANVLHERGEKFHRMILTETDFFTPTPDSKIRAIQTGGMPRGDIPGEAWRSSMMLKSFPLTIIDTHLYRAAMQRGMANRVSYFAQLILGGMVMGGISLQAKDIMAGREPRPIDLKFIPAAIAQGGGIGLLGDFIFSDVNRFGGGPASSVLGPTGELINKTASLTLGNIQEAIKGEETNVLGESVQFVKRYTPSLWQVNLMKNALFDGLAEWVDPIGEQERHRRIINTRRKDFDQNFWWKPGEPKPEFLK